MPIIKSPLGEIWKVKMEADKLLYQAFLTGKTIENILSYQFQIDRTGNAHFCLYDQDQNLHYFLWEKGVWQRIIKLSQVPGTYFLTQEHQGNSHLLVQETDGHYQHFIYEKTQLKKKLLLTTDQKDTIPWNLLTCSPGIILLVRKRTSGLETIIKYQLFFLEENSWSEEKTWTTLTGYPGNLSLWTHHDQLYLTYLDFISSTPTLRLANLQPATGQGQDHSFPDLSPRASPPLLSLSSAGVTLLCPNQKSLLFWISADEGWTWKNRMELTMPCSLSLVPVTGYNGTLTHLIACTGLSSLNFTEPALFTADDLLTGISLTGPSPYFRQLGGKDKARLRK
ncbi:MAG TPA: hypothetical protein GX711_05755 [Clostridia bacterium]|nr:hypothetical protein [Clostridia bacterium]